MTILPPSPFTDSGVAPSSPDEAAACDRSRSPDAAAEIKQKLLAAIEDDYRFVLDVGKFLFDIGCAPDSFEKYISMLDVLADDPPPLFLQRTG